MTSEEKTRRAEWPRPPVFLDRAAIDRACTAIEEAGAIGVRVLAFPEAFIRGHPDSVWSAPANDKKQLNPLYGELLAQFVIVPREATDRLGVPELWTIDRPHRRCSRVVIV